MPDQTTIRCNLCGADDYQLLHRSTIGSTPATVEEYTSTVNKYGFFHSLVSCRRCGLIYMNPRDSGITELYKKVVDEAYLESWEERALTFRKHLKILDGYKAGKGKILDIGCYAGIFLNEAKRNGYDAFGIEPSVWAADYARKKTGAQVLSTSWQEASFAQGGFDVVTMWDVVEHLEDPSACLKKAYGWLKNDGIIALSTHNIKGWFARLLGKRYPWLMRFHLYHFEPKTISALLLKNGFEPILVKAYLKTISLKYMLSRLGIKLYAKPLERVKFSFDTGDMFMVVARKNEDYLN